MKDKFTFQSIGVVKVIKDKIGPNKKWLVDFLIISWLFDTKPFFCFMENSPQKLNQMHVEYKKIAQVSKVEGDFIAFAKFYHYRYLSQQNPKKTTDKFNQQLMRDLKMLASN